MTNKPDRLDEVLDDLLTTEFNTENSPIPLLIPRKHREQMAVKAKQQIQKLIVEARIDEGKKHWHATMKDGYAEWSANRLAQLQKNKKFNSK